MDLYVTFSNLSWKTFLKSSKSEKQVIKRCAEDLRADPKLGKPHQFQGLKVEHWMHTCGGFRFIYRFSEDEGWLKIDDLTKVLP